MTCSIVGLDYQPFPQEGELFENSNLPLGTLRQRINPEQTTTYCYVIDSVKNEDGRLVQRGSGPNLQGDMITLCTCKHRMRTFLSLDDWEGKWIAGFTGVGAGGGRNALVYLTKIGHAFESHHDLWYSEEISAETKRAKSAKTSRHGDLFQPTDEAGDPFDPRSYYPPCGNHSHCGDEWHGDVRYTGRSSREAALLVGDPVHSYLWDRPVAFFPISIGRGQRKMFLSDLLFQLQAS